MCHKYPWRTFLICFILFWCLDKLFYLITDYFEKIRKINSWSDYEKFRISQNIEKYFWDFVVDLKSKIPFQPSFIDLLSVWLVFFIFYSFTQSICLKLYEKKNNN